ncbi:MAG: polysaccharide biosynthesis/export family protein [Bacteroidales bacterium]|nr:polysaccharide biosynthesis/export family protein [Bacteroidales bacterium]
MNSRLLSVLALTVAVLSACSAPKNVIYFQDTTDKEISTDVQPLQIRFRPEDKISIIVNCPSRELMNQFNLPYVSRYVGSTTETSVSGSQGGVSGYIIDADGNINFPVLGKLHVAGLTRAEVSDLIKNELQNRDLVKDPVVTVDYMNLYVSIMGEVSRPGRYAISRDHFTILDALSMAGDLTIDGRRDNIRVIREENGVQKTYLLDLRSASNIASSPAYYLCQSDIIYVEPTTKKARTSTAAGNTFLTPSFWISVASLAATLVSTITVVALRVQ